MKIDINKSDLTAILIAVAVGSILISGFHLKIDLTGEKMVSSIGLVAVIVGVFVWVKSSQKGKSDDDK